MRKLKFIPVNTPVIGSYEKKYVLDVFKKNQLTSGDYLKKFEEKFSSLHNKKFGVSVSSGTAALEIAIKSLSLKENSEVIIPSFSIISTALCVVKNKLKPVLVDCDIKTWNVTFEEVKKKINKKTSAIILTHIYGLPVDMKEIITLAKKRNIKIIEHAAEVIGLKYKNKFCGSFGDISTFSFYANKHITTGEGGMILTNNKKIYNKCMSLKNLCFGNSKYNRFNHEDIGWNYRMTNIQAAIGFGQLKNINKIVKKKIEIGNIYYNGLKNNKNFFLQSNKTSSSKNIYWVFGIVLKDKYLNKRNQVMDKLLEYNIDTRPFFYSMNNQKIFKKNKNFIGSKYPNSEYLSINGLYIPSGLGLKNYEIKYIIDCVNKIIN